MALNNMWEQYFAEREVVTANNQRLIEEKFREVEAYHEKELKKVYPDSGVIFTRHEEDIKEGRFCIWIDNGSITHKYIKLVDVGIAPLQMEAYPIRPDKY